MGCKNLGFKGFFNEKKQKSKKFNFLVLKVFFRKPLKIHILYSQSQQKIVAFQSI